MGMETLLKTGIPILGLRREWTLEIIIELLQTNRFAHAAFLKWIRVP